MKPQPQDVKITLTKVYSDRLLAEINSLLPQLSERSEKLNCDNLKEILSSDSSNLMVATLNGQLVGILTLVVYSSPTGKKSIIEDVVVDQKARGMGIGKTLCKKALECSKELGAEHVDLTSHPDRKVANQLYRNLGFQPRQTNLYRYP